MARRKGRMRWGMPNLPEEDRIRIDLLELLKAKHEKRALEDKTITIKCLSKFHKIRFQFPGNITLLDHPDLKGEETMMKLGGDKPECLTFIEEWRRGQNSAGQIVQARPIAQQFLQARVEWGKVRKENKASYRDWLLRPLKERLKIRLRRIYDSLNERIDERFGTKEPEDRWGYRYSSSYSDAGGPETIMRPIINLRFQDLINKRVEESEDTKHEESN